MLQPQIVKFMAFYIFAFISAPSWSFHLTEVIKWLVQTHRQNRMVKSKLKLRLLCADCLFFDFCYRETTFIVFTNASHTVPALNTYKFCHFCKLNWALGPLQTIYTDLKRVLIMTLLAEGVIQGQIAPCVGLQSIIRSECKCLYCDVGPQGPAQLQSQCLERVRVCQNALLSPSSARERERKRESTGTQLIYNLALLSKHVYYTVIWQPVNATFTSLRWLLQQA